MYVPKSPRNCAALLTDFPELCMPSIAALRSPRDTVVTEFRTRDKIFLNLGITV